MQQAWSSEAIPTRLAFIRLSIHVYYCYCLSLPCVETLRAFIPMSHESHALMIHPPQKAPVCQVATDFSRDHARRFGMTKCEQPVHSLKA